jgi:3,4-dihydroxy 2-butanone 4-phosphate synthase/GTP cyclohydrolase II
MPIKRVLKAIESIKQGKMVVMIDDEDRENEGDLVYASTFSTPEKVNFMATHGKGLICVTLSEDTAQRLDLDPMVGRNTSSHETAFTISVDAKEATTGISATERDMTIKILANPMSSATELVKPGHIFPLISRKGGVLVRTGHTEGSADLCRLSGLQESAVICEIMKDDGEMARRDDLLEFSEKHNLDIIYISDLVEYRMQNEILVTQSKTEEIDFFGVKVQKLSFLDHEKHTHTVIQFYKTHEIANIKFHHIQSDVDLLTDSESYQNLISSIEYLKTNGGLLLFIDSRKTEESLKIKEFGIGAQILKSLGVSKIKLLTNKKTKEYIGIHGFGLEVTEEVILSE